MRQRIAKSVTPFILMLLIATGSPGAESSGAGRLAAGHYTIFIQPGGASSNDGAVLLELHNNTSFRIRVPIACCQQGGAKTDKIFPLYRMDKLTGKVEVPNLDGDVVDGHWLAPGESMRFEVPSKYSRRHSIHVPFNYEWELDGKGPQSGVGEPEHYVVYHLGFAQ